MFSCKFCEISKNTFLTEHLRWLLLFFFDKRNKNITLTFCTADIYLFKIQKGKRQNHMWKRHWRRSGVFIVNFEQISHIDLVFPLLDNKQSNSLIIKWRFYVGGTQLLISYAVNIKLTVFKVVGETTGTTLKAHSQVWYHFWRLKAL